MATLKTIFECPAYRVLENRSFNKDGETLAVKFGDLYHTFTLGSVAGFAIERGECPIKAIANNEEWKIKDPYTPRPLWYAFGNGLMITSSKQAQKTHYGVEFGDTIVFHGRTFKIVESANQNLSLIHI